MFSSSFSRVSSRFTVPNTKIKLQQKCSLHLHEYQSQNIMKKYGINVSLGDVATTVEEARTIAEKMGQNGVEDFVVKAQVLAGGRGLGVFSNGFKGGVHLCNSPGEVEFLASKMLGQNLITKQTGKEGKLVSKVLIAQRYFNRRESYLAILLDRKECGAVVVASKKGGVNIEQVAEEDPSAIFKLPLRLQDGISSENAHHIVHALGLPNKLVEEGVKQVQNIYKLFTSTDATQVEINPLVETSSGQLICLDAKINFDDNASYRQKEVFAERDYTQEDPREVAASKFDLSFIGLDGSVGCLVNGAGLAMATLDIIKLYGGNPANFLDVGGGASAKQVTEALRIISSDPKVNAILINIFGGIMRCDVIAEGIINAANILNLDTPIVVRLEGTNVEAARKLLKNSSVKVINAYGLEDAAKKAVDVGHIMHYARKAHLKVHFEE